MGGDENGGEISSEAIAAAIDHTVLHADTRYAQIETLCQQARQFQFAAVCVAPTWISAARDLLSGSEVQIATVNGFPHGDSLPAAKAAEALQSVRAGADEIDMVLQVGRFLGGDTDFARDDIRAVVDAAKSEKPARVKVILEVGYLNDDQIRQACLLAEEAGADYVKTSTGFCRKKEVKEKWLYVQQMKAAVGDRLKIKAAGGIGDLQAAAKVIAAGATRIGSSSLVRSFQ